MKVSRILPALVLLALPTATIGAGLFAVVPAKGPPSAPVSAPLAPLNVADKAFLQQAVLDALLGEQLGELGRLKGSDVLVQVFSARLAADHERLGLQARGLSVTHGVRPPGALDPERRAIVTRLERLKSRDFDVAFATAVRRSEGQMLARYQTQSREGDDPDLRTEANGMVPEIMRLQREADALWQLVSPAGL